MIKDKRIVLTGIKPTGELHIGNAIGAIFPAINHIRKVGGKSYFFVADLHALNQIQDKNKLQFYIRSVSSAWLACGIMDFDNVVFYRQSDIPEVSELTTYLMAITPKSEMNYAHAYKKATGRNKESGKGRDAGINMGLYTYPILMAADILLPQSEIIPVGKDQVQHVEIARVIAERFNSVYGKAFTLPRHSVLEEFGVIPGIDGRKMSKAYGNVIPLFADKDEWFKLVKKIPTNSTSKGESVSGIEKTIVYQIFKGIADDETTQQLKKELENGSIGWKEAKERLVVELDLKFGKMRESYLDWMNSPDHLSRIFDTGAAEVRRTGRKTLERVKSLVGTTIS